MPLPSGLAFPSAAVLATVERVPEPRIGEVVCRHEGSRLTQPLGRLARGDAHGGYAGGDGGGDARYRVLESEGLFGRNVQFLQRRFVGRRVRLYRLHLVGEYDR